MSDFSSYYRKLLPRFQTITLDPVEVKEREDVYKDFQNKMETYLKDSKENVHNIKSMELTGAQSEGLTESIPAYDLFMIIPHAENSIDIIRTEKNDLVELKTKKFEGLSQQEKLNGTKVLEHCLTLVQGMLKYYGAISGNFQKHKHEPQIDKEQIHVKVIDKRDSKHTVSINIRPTFDIEHDEMKKNLVPFNTTTWRFSFAKKERDLLKQSDRDEGCRKCVLSMLKNLCRNRYPEVKSYQIKNVFLWDLRKYNSSDKWKMDQLGNRFFESLQQLDKALQSGEFEMFNSRYIGGKVNVFRSMSDDDRKKVQQRVQDDLQHPDRVLQDIKVIK